MNSKSNIKKRFTLLAILLLTLSANIVQAGEEDKHGLWTTLELSKKVTKKFKIGAELEYRTTDYLKQSDRIAIGISGQYKLTNWLKMNAGHIFMVNYNPGKVKVHFDDLGREDGFNYDHSYWDKRNRVYIAFTGEAKVGRFKISLRERLQYTRTHAQIIDEDKHRVEITEKEVFETIAADWDQDGKITSDETFTIPIIGANNSPIVEEIRTALPTITEKDAKEHKNNTVLRSRLAIEWDISKCKLTPFASAELYTRIDKWDRFDKLRSRFGVNWEINKDNSIEFYYLFENAGNSKDPDTHVFGLGYSLDL